MHTIRDCNYCGNDYMFHGLDRHLYDEICQNCSEKFVVLEDEQSADNMSTILAYDYKKHNNGHKILFFGNLEETKKFKKKVNSQIY